MSDPRSASSHLLAALACLLAATIAACGGGSGGGPPLTGGDPGTAEWQPVPRARVAGECRLDPDLLAAADAAIDRPWAIVRYGRLCHEFYPAGREQADDATEAYSTTKTLGAVVTGVAAYQTRDLPRTGRKTGPLSDEDRVDHWLDDFSFNPDARIAHVLAMLAHNSDLGFGARRWSYDLNGSIQINRLSDVISAALAQDPDRLGRSVEELTQRHLFAPLGMRHSVWTGGAPDKIFAYTWVASVRDMARLGLLLVRRGVWSGERILAEDWVHRLTHPAFEDAYTAYGYLTWLNSPDNRLLSDAEHPGPGDVCAPFAIHPVFPHGLSEAADCGYSPPLACAQTYDVGVWYAAGLYGQYVVGHPGLDLVLIVKDYGDLAGPTRLWEAVRPALVALDPTFAGDEAGFCASYARGEYAPDLR
jgi:Beta-lactamase